MYTENLVAIFVFKVDLVINFKLELRLCCCQLCFFIISEYDNEFRQKNLLHLQKNVQNVTPHRHGQQSFNDYAVQDDTKFSNKLQIRIEIVWLSIMLFMISEYDNEFRQNTYFNCRRMFGMLHHIDMAGYLPMIMQCRMTPNHKSYQIVGIMGVQDLNADMNRFLQEAPIVLNLSRCKKLCPVRPSHIQKCKFHL